MAKQKVSLLWALLFAACLMNSARAFVVHQRALMRTRWAYGAVTSSSRRGGCVADGGACAVQWRERAKRVQRDRRMTMNAGGEEASASEGQDLPGSSRANFFVEAPDDPHHALGSAVSAVTAAGSSSGSGGQRSAAGSEGASSLLGKKDGFVTDSDGIGGGGGGGGVG
ncbi:unnamed protein product, partial [Scytosiphon promiscuus]